MCCPFRDRTFPQKTSPVFQCHSLEAGEISEEIWPLGLQHYWFVLCLACICLTAFSSNSIPNMVKLPKAQEAALFYKNYLKLSPGRQRRKPPSCQTAHQGRGSPDQQSLYLLTHFPSCGAPFTDTQAKPWILESSLEWRWWFSGGAHVTSAISNRGRVDFCAAAVSQPGKGTHEITLPVRGLCQHRAGSEFSDTVQFPVISTGGMALNWKRTG